VIDFRVAWLCFRFPFAFGKHGAFGGFLGTTNLLEEGLNVATTDWAGFFFQWTFASATCTIVSGAGAERYLFQGCLLSAVMLSAVVYPMAVHWCWSSDAWLANGAHNDIAFFDFAGSGVVHVTGDSIASMLINVIGARAGRFNERARTKVFPPTTCCLLAAAGTLLLIMGGSDSIVVLSWLHLAAILPSQGVCVPSLPSEHPQEGSPPSSSFTSEDVSSTSKSS